MKILVIDDSKTLRFAHEKALTRAGHEVISAVDGEEGLRVARKENPDLILLDLMLPKITGQDVLRTLKHDVRTRHVPVIIVSELSKTNAAKLRNEGAMEFVEKNCELFENYSEAVVRKVEMVLARASHLREIGWH
jgi:DNA-binding response OmpR family regulator